MFGGRVDYAVGVNAGASDTGLPFRTPTEDVYGRLGFKIGGMREDGEGSKGPADTFKPWAETALHLYGFAYHSNTFFDTSDPTALPPAANDVGTAYGFGGRVQLGSLELNASWYRDRHNHGTDAGTEATAKVFSSELSYVLFPWLVPAVRVENIALDANDAAGASLPGVNAWHVMPGIAFLIRPNVKLVAVANWEHANGFPSSAATPGTLLPWAGGSGDVGAFTIAPGPSTVDARSSSSEFETIGFFFAWAI
jgi:hypothetical protein